VSDRISLAVCNDPDMYGNTALHVAANQGNAGVLGALLPHTKNMNHVNSDGCAPIHLAIVVESLQCVEMLIEAGADLSLQSYASGATPLHMACSGAHARIVEALMQAGVSAAAKDVVSFQVSVSAPFSEGSKFYDRRNSLLLVMEPVLFINLNMCSRFWGVAGEFGWKRPEKRTLVSAANFKTCQIQYF
jgi:ankyrin repeat protein